MRLYWAGDKLSKWIDLDLHGDLQSSMSPLSYDCPPQKKKKKRKGNLKKEKKE